MDLITSENINKIRKHRYFNDNEMNNQLYMKTRLLMTAAATRYNHNETLLLMRNNDYKYEITSQNLETSVGFNGVMLDALYNTNVNYTAIHNHPMDSSFSVGDLNQLLEYERLNLLILCTNSCKYSAALYKTDKFNKGIIRNLAIKLISTGKKLKLINTHSDAIPIINLFCKYGLLYLYYINY